MKKNKYTKVFLSVHAFDQHMKKNDKKYDFIGIEEPKNKKNIQFIDGNFNITEDIRIYTNVPYKKQIISDNHLFVLQNDMYLEDSFEHEIYLVINEDENCVLFSGCSHKGIENIIDSLEENNQLEFTHVIGGFHFSHYDSFNIKQTDYLINLGSKFGNRKNTSFYTGHCTGEEAYLELRQKMRDNLYKLNTGVIIIFIHKSKF
jgi:7,8-dihydropterin-6-yl-methyl-4-(beta-D-ribofuranosyl)aminobenzene 5'-phosphate synthase